MATLSKRNGGNGSSYGQSLETGTLDMRAFDVRGKFAEHGKWLRSVVYARLGEPQAIDDVMQEIALAVAKNQAPIQDTRKVAPWLYQIAVRQTLLFRRKQGRKRKLQNTFRDRVATGLHARSNPDPLQWLIAHERAARIRLALERLHRRDLEILMLKYDHEMSYQEIAERLGITNCAVEARLHRARQRLRNFLANLDVTC